MIKTLKYVNSLGESVVFGGETDDGKRSPWHYGKNDLLSFDLDYDTVGGAITSFYSGVRKFDLRVFLSRGTLAERNRFVDVVSYDTYVGEPGTLYLGDSYMRCYVCEYDPTKWHVSDGRMMADLTIASDQPVWVRKVSKTLMNYSTTLTGGLDYPYDYPFDFLFSKGSSDSIVNPFMLPAKCDIMFPGPCIDPYVVIAGNRYQVRVTATKGQLVVVRGFGKKKDIVLKDASGSERSIFANGIREKGAQIFAQVPVGESQITWAGAFNIQVDLYEERYSPWLIA